MAKQFFRVNCPDCGTEFIVEAVVRPKDGKQQCEECFVYNNRAATAEVRAKYGEEYNPYSSYVSGRFTPPTDKFTTPADDNFGFGRDESKDSGFADFDTEDE